MAFLFQKFQEAAKTLAKSPTFARDPRHLQFETDINRLFLFTSYNRLGKNAIEKEIDEIIDMASKASVADQQKQVQENVQSQIKSICQAMNDILKPKSCNLGSQEASHPSGLSWAIGKAVLPSNQPAIPDTEPLTRKELSQSLRNHIGYTLELRPSGIPHKEAGQGLFLDGEAEVGSVIAMYPGIVYSPAYYQSIPGYPRVDASNSYLITRYDGLVINAQPWGVGGEAREVWDGASLIGHSPHIPENSERASDRIWRMLSKPSETERRLNVREELERRNPLAFGHFANHPSEGLTPNVMVCPYDFPVNEEMRAYIPNIMFGPEKTGKMKRFGTFWFKSGNSGDEEVDIPVIKTLLLVATRDLSDEEVLLNYRLSNSKRCPAWYNPVDEEEDRRRWS